MYSISKLTSQFDDEITATINNKTKPLGALGQLEVLAQKLVRIYRHAELPLEITQPSLIVFAGDHGIAAHGVSIAPSEVTQQMVANFAAGGAAINVFTRQLGWQLDVVDAGILQAMPAEFGIIEQRLGTSTHPIHLEQAMTKEQVELGFKYAKQLVQDKYKQGCNLLAFGEMGIGNTSSASAIMAAVMGLTAEQTVGKGTGIDDETLIRKTQLIDQALKLHQTSPKEPIELLAKLGGFEIVQICGAMLAAAELNIPVVVDGFICTAAAMVAKLIDPNVADYFIFAHCSGEQGHKTMLAWFEQQPLLDLGLRLGEGTGAALSLPLLQSALAFYNDMASFEQAGVENVV